MDNRLYSVSPTWKVYLTGNLANAGQAGLGASSNCVLCASMILTESFSNVKQEPSSSPASQTRSFCNVSLFQVKAPQSTQSFRPETCISPAPPPSPHPTVHYTPGPPDSASLRSPNSSFLCAKLSPPQGFPQELHLGLASGLCLFASPVQHLFLPPWQRLSSSF